MSIPGVQILSLSFAFFMLYVTSIHYKRNNIRAKEFTFWVIIWLGMILATIRPQLFDPIVHQLYFLRLLDLGLFCAFAILTYLGFKNHVGVLELEKRIEKIVRTDAIVNAKKKK